MKQLHTIRQLLLIFIIALFLSGFTAIPIDAELESLIQLIPVNTQLYTWLERVLSAYTTVKAKHPFLLYGFDWLAFAHFTLAFLFIGPYRDPVRNIWVIQFGLIACIAILPFAFIAGHYRQIPLGWRFIDCSFGIIGFAVLFVCYRKIIQSTMFKTTYSVNI